MFIMNLLVVTNLVIYPRGEVQLNSNKINKACWLEHQREQLLQEYRGDQQS
jgi:hypothetical protein